MCIPIFILCTHALFSTLFHLLFIQRQIQSCAFREAVNYYYFIFFSYSHVYTREQLRFFGLFVYYFSPEISCSDFETLVTLHQIREF